MSELEELKQQVEVLTKQKEFLELELKLILSEIQVLKELVSRLTPINTPTYPYPWTPMFPFQYGTGPTGGPYLPYNPWIYPQPYIITNSTENTTNTNVSNTTTGDKR